MWNLQQWILQWESTVLDLMDDLMDFHGIQKTARKEKHGKTDHVEVIRR